jgi:hypothetical protein
MTRNDSAEADPDQFVRENRGTLRRIIRHSDDKFTRALCLAALVRYGDDPDVADLRDELERAEEAMAE